MLFWSFSGWVLGFEIGLVCVQELGLFVGLFSREGMDRVCVIKR